MLQLSEEDTAEFREIFGLVDTDNSGKISPEELGQLTKKLGLKYTEVRYWTIDHQKQLESMVNDIDIDRNGEIDFDGHSTVIKYRIHYSDVT